MTRTQVIALGLLVSACGAQRLALPTKATPATARVHLAFDVDKALVARMSDGPSATDDPALDDGHDAVMAETVRSTGVRLGAALRGELPRRRIAKVVVTADTEHDLALSGTFRAGPTSVDLDWTLVERASGTIIVGGVASDMWFTGDVTPYLDEILAAMLASDIDRFGPKGSGATVARAPSLGMPPTSANDGRRAFAVVVGIDRYREDLPEATHAENDARAFATYAETTLGVPPAHTKLLLGDRAGRADLASAFEEWLPRNVTGPSDTVYVFFSGHGAPDPQTGGAYLVPWDADPAYLATRGVALDALYAGLSRLKAKRVVVFIDACFSGAGPRSVLAKGTRPLVPVADARPVSGLVTFSAAGPRETTGAASDAPHGLFTRHLLGGLGGGADQDGDRAVTIDELTAYLVEKVSTDARLANREQTPTSTRPPGLDGAIRLVEGLAR